MYAAIIQSPNGDQDSFLNASWWMGVCRAIASYLVIFIMAPWVAAFYGRPELTSLLRVALLSIVLFSAMSPRAVLAQRQMKLGRWALLTNGGGICGVLVTIILSFVLRNVWALAIGYCAENAFRLIWSYILCPAVPSFRFNKAAGKELLSFSRGVFGLAVLNLIMVRADIFVLARLYSNTALGFYSLAVAVVTTPSVFCTNMLGQALMPAMSSVQEDGERLNRIFVEVTSWILLVGIPGSTFICLAGSSLLSIIYGARYAAASGPLSIASVVTLITVLNSIPTIVLFAKGKPALHRHAVVMMAAITVIAIYPSAKYLGLAGGQAAVLLAASAGYLYQLILLRSLIGLKLSSFGSAFISPALGAGAMLAIVFGSHQLRLTESPHANLLLCTVTCLVIYAVCAPVHLRTSKKHISSYGEARTPESAAAL
jgi:O-antigen/teichoic acid export membrane protein